MSVNNFSREIKFDRYKFQLPMTFQIGACVELFDLIGESKEDITVNMEVAALHPRDHHERIHLGSELSYRDCVF